MTVPARVGGLEGSSPTRGVAEPESLPGEGPRLVVRELGTEPTTELLPRYYPPPATGQGYRLQASLWVLAGWTVVLALLRDAGPVPIVIAGLLCALGSSLRVIMVRRNSLSTPVEWSDRVQEGQSGPSFQR